MMRGLMEDQGNARARIRSRSDVSFTLLKSEIESQANRGLEAPGAEKVIPVWVNTLLRHFQDLNVLHRKGRGGGYLTSRQASAGTIETWTNLTQFFE